MRTTIRELIIYTCFVLVLSFSKLKNIAFYASTLNTINTLVTFGMTSAQMYFYTSILKSLFSGSMEVNDPNTFWNVSTEYDVISFKVEFKHSRFQYLEGDFLDNLYWEFTYAEGGDANFICPGGDEGVGPCPIAPTDRNILYENRLLGVPR